MKTKTVCGQPSWRLANAGIEAFVTVQGGHLGPVTHRCGRRKVQPYSVAPWAEEPLGRDVIPLLKSLRGDFFCLPFGGNSTPYRGERHPGHGQTASANWKFQSLETRNGRSGLHLRLDTTVRSGRVDKRVWIVEGHPVVYQQHVIRGMRGPMSLGHHAMLKFPDEPGCGRISTSRFVRGQVLTEPFERPENRGYSILKPGAVFKSLDRVPTVTGEWADLTRYPARRGYDDLAAIIADPEGSLAWTAVVFPGHGYAWFALKDPRVLRQTVFWISNGGRHYPPWNGRHVNVLGLEEVTGWFHFGLAESARPNPWSKLGHPTCIPLAPDRPFVVNYLMATVPIPRGFDRVASIRPGAGRDSVALKSASGKTVTVPVDVGCLTSGPR